MPSTNVQPVRPGGGIHTADAARARVADLKPIKNLDRLAAAAPGAEPPHEVLVRALKAGRQPYPVVIAGDVILFGLKLLSAAKRTKWKTVEVATCAGCAGLHDGYLLFTAGGLHLRAALDRAKPGAFAARLLTAAVYQACAKYRKRRPPRRFDPQKRRDWKEAGERLIREEFGYSQRSLVRYARLLGLPPCLGTAVDRGEFPARLIDRAANLPAEELKALTDALTDGIPLTDLVDQFFGEFETRKKTTAAAARAINAGIHQIATQARGREDSFALRLEDHPIATEAAEYLSQWLAARPKPAVDEELRELGEVVGRHKRANGATRGGRGAAEGRP